MAQKKKTNTKKTARKTARKTTRRTAQAARETTEKTAATAVNMHETMAQATTEMVNAAFDAQRQMVETMTGWTRSMKTDTPAFEAMGDRTSRFFSGMADITADGMNRMSGVMNENFRFSGRMLERALDAAWSRDAARSPESTVSTAQNIMTDLVEHNARTSEEVVRIAADKAEAVQGLLAECCRTA